MQTILLFYNKFYVNYNNFINLRSIIQIMWSCDKWRQSGHQWLTMASNGSQTQSLVPKWLFAVPLHVTVGIAVGVRVLIAVVIAVIVLRDAFVYPSRVALIEVLALMAATSSRSPSSSARATVIAIITIHLLHSLLLLGHRLGMCFLDVTLFVTDRLFGSSERRFGRLFRVKDYEAELPPPIALAVERQLNSLDISEFWEVIPDIFFGHIWVDSSDKDLFANGTGFCSLGISCLAFNDMRTVLKDLNQ